ncbi:hypothetical protein K440DRAFT_664446 [Wilcoxina mikolae CBS 423.85]|nr:hypothetical protein K440DRAFT_664446 [Wilcoxina mikolae CBS 423.85]
MASPLPASVTLFDYLSNYRPDASDISPLCKPSPNTRNDSKYAADDISSPVAQGIPEFTYEELIHQYGHMLHNTVVDKVEAFISPQKGVEHKKLYSETGVSHFAARSVILQANRALEAISTADQGRSLMVDNEGRAVGADADRVGLLEPGRELRLVGDIKPSWKWQSTWRHAPLHSANDTEYRQVLSQVHYYMNASGVRYGYILTDREFLVVMRHGKTFADIVVSEVVNWEDASGMNVALAIWYLHMLATDSPWKAPTLERPVPEAENFADTAMHEGDSDDDGDSSDDGNFSLYSGNR